MQTSNNSDATLVADRVFRAGV